MKLFGSTTSPYVRRIRLYFSNLNYEFVNLDIFSSDGSDELAKQNPAKKVPALLDGDLCIYDSRVIYRYLAEKQGETTLTWPQENLLTLIDAANDSLVTLLISKRSEIDTTEDKLLFNLQHSRLDTVFDVLEKEVSSGAFEGWNYPSVCLFCLLDWVKFRDLYDLSQHTNLLNFWKNNTSQKGVKETDPR